MALNDWADGEAGGTPLSAERLNERDAAIETAAGTAEWDGIADKPTTFPPEIGSTASTAVAGNDARLTAGAAGTATVRAIGATATTAAAGNHSHAASAVTATAIGPGTATSVQGILAELAARISALETP